MDTEALVEQVLKQVMGALRKGEGGLPDAVCSASSGGVCVVCGQCVTQRLPAVERIISEGACRISARPGVGQVETRLARMIDHTLLKAEITEDQIRELCREAAAYCFASVCINPTWVELSARLLRRSGVKVCTVIGFPLGADTAETNHNYRFHTASPQKQSSLKKEP